MKFQLEVAGRKYELEVPSGNDGRSSGRTKLSAIQSSFVQHARPDGADGVCRSPVNGIVVRVSARPGDQVEANDPLLVLEAMKMETSLTAPVAGRVKRLHVVPGQAVKARQVLAEFE
jgi:biotin carboxyl carrier protein